MDFLSIIAGLDNLRKLAVILGLALMGIGAFYPMQKALQLNERKINLEEYKKINEAELKTLQSDITVFTAVEGTHSTKLKKLTQERDSLLQAPLSDNSKFKINYLQTQIVACQKSDEQELKDIKSKILQVDKSNIKRETIENEVENLEFYLSTYHVVEFIAIAIGIFMFGYGIHNWKRSEKDSDLMKQIEIRIKQQELKKLEKENTNP